MLYELAHWVQKRCPWIWDAVEWMNSALFAVMKGGRLRRLEGCLVEGVRLADVGDVDALVQFFERQPEESFKWFRPHGFDEETLGKLLRRKSYIIYVMEDEGEIIGYAFLRCFVNGKCFLGKMVDVGHQGKGVCTVLCTVGMKMANCLGIRMFESINKENLGSMRASQKACDVVVVEELENGDVLIEDRMREMGREGNRSDGEK